MPWQTFGDLTAISEDNVKIMVERADALLKAQDDGLKAIEIRMSSLFTQSVTLASAAIAATATAFAASQATTPGAPPWATAWVAQSLAALSVVWLLAVSVAASSLLSQNWSASGMHPRQLYDSAILSAPAISLRLAVSRTLQTAIDENEVQTRRYAVRLSWVIGLLSAGPVVTAALAIYLAKPTLVPLAVGIALVISDFWLVWYLYARIRT